MRPRCVAWLFLSAAAGGAVLAAAPPRADGIDRSHPLGLAYYQPYGMVSTRYATPHVAWGKPLAGGPIQVLVMAPQWTHRETVELAQRLDIRFTPWMCYSSETLTVTQADPAFSAYTVSQRLVVETLGKHLSAPHDVIVVGKIRWSILPAEDRFRILKKVSEGTGLVYVCPPASDRELEIVFRKHPNDGHEEILRGVPWQSLPRLRHADRARLVRTGTFGKGRVVVLDYQEPTRPPEGKRLDIGMHSLTPNWAQVGLHAKWPRTEEPALELGPYEYYQSLVARAVRWAAGRTAGVRLSSNLPPRIAADKRIAVSARADGAAASVSATVRTADGRAVFAASGTSFELPALPAGHYLLDLWARDADGKVLEWSSQAFEVHFGNAVKRVELVQRLLSPGDFVRARVELARPLAEGQSLSAELWDLHERQIAVGKATAAGTSAKVRLGPLAPVHLMHELRVKLVERGAVRVEHRHRFPVRARFRWGDFASVVWGGSDNSLPTFHMLKKLREVDQADVIDTLPGHAWRTKKAKETHSAEVEMDTLARNCARADLMICPYNSRFGVLGSPKGHISDRSMADSKRIEGIGKHFAIDARVYGPYGPFVWTHGDESHYSAGPDVDWHPAALARFRRLLRERLYPSLDALNREWGTRYTAWDAVMPTPYAEAKKTGNFAPWLTHKLSSDVIYAEFYKRVGDFLRGGGDAGARTGFDGGCGLWGPNLGSDWWVLARHTQLLHSYHSESLQHEVFRSFVPPDAATVRGMWYGTYGPHWSIGPNTIEYCHYHPWYSLFHHLNTTWFWTMGSPGPLSGYAPDLTSLGFMQARTRALRAIRGGIGKLLLSCPRADDGIAIHWSESSRLADSLYATKANQWSRRYVDAVGNVVRSLEDAGCQYRFVAYEEIERGALAERGYGVLFLPHSRAVSDREAARILEFARRGGTVVADIVPATLTHTGAKRATPALAALFPANTPGTLTRLGKGRALLLGTDPLKDYYDIHRSTSRKWTELKGRWRQMAALLRTHAGLGPAVTVEALEGDMPPTEAARFDADGIQLVGLIRSYFLRDSQAYKARIRLPRVAHLYDVRRGAYLKRGNELVRVLDYQAELLALSPYRVKAVDVRIDGAVAPGKPLRVSLAVAADGGPATGKHALHVSLVGPHGAERPWYARNVLAPKGRATATVPLALNEKAGTYVVRARDCMSGVTGEARFTIPGEGAR